MEVNEQQTLDLNIDDLFKDLEDEKPQDQPKEETAADKNKDGANEMTKSVSKRINEVKAATEKETRDAMAKELGFKNYEDFAKAKEKEMLKNAGVDDEELAPVIQKLVDQRFAEDPRFKRLEEIEANEKARFVKEQLKEINKFAGTTYKDVDELPKDVLGMWEKTGNLKQAYLAIQGETLINRNVASKQNGSLAHLANPGEVGTGNNVRLLTDKEKAIYQMVDPDGKYLNELDKKTISL